MAAHHLVEFWVKDRETGEITNTKNPYHWRLSEQGRRWAKQIGWLKEEADGEVA